MERIRAVCRMLGPEIGAVREAELERLVESERARARNEPDGSGWFDPALHYVFDQAAADLATEFFERFLVHSTGELRGHPFTLEPWQAIQVIRPLFGWKRADGSRKYRVAWDEIPRKNGKSTKAAGVGLKLTFADGEPGAQVFSTAADREQARVVFKEARAMRDMNDELRRRSLAYKDSMVVPALGASYRVLSADAGTKHGLNAHGIINDELHAHKSRDLYDVMHTSTGARRQWVEFNITTAGYDRRSVAWELHDYALKVAEGLIPDDTFMPVVFAAGAEDDWKDPRIWAKANPNLGISISLENIRKECEKAQAIPGYENTFKQLHLNLWTEQATRWLPMDAWDQCAGPPDWKRLPAEMAGAVCYGGLDLSTTTDITALVLVFRKPDGKFVWIPFFWIPEDNMRERVRRDRVPYDVWVREGALRVTPGNTVDQDLIRRDINVLAERYRIPEVCIDRWNAAQITTQLQGDGFTVVAFGQGFQSMSAPSKELERLVVGRLLEHGGHPTLRWMAGNVAVRRDPAGNIKPDKAESTGRIDGIVAGVMGLARAIVDTGPQESVYKTRGVIAI